jgi:2,4-dienoyl-CoA reductase-like NADH-dependent reductase (Old Yellow Enzyme family)
MNEMLFTPFHIGAITLANRIVSLPLYLAYPDEDHEVNDLVLDYYDEIASSGVGLVVVENATVEPCGLGNPRTMLVSDDRFIPGLSRLATTIKRHGVPAVLQIHHAGRYAKRPDRIAPSAIETWGVLPQAMDQACIERVIRAYAAGARRAREAGFDAVELHGGTGYLLPQFLSPRTNLRDDAWGGDEQRRMRFPLEVLAAVRAEVGEDFTVGYRFLADEYMPGGLTLDDTVPFAQELARAGVGYLSVMTGCYDSFSVPRYLQDDAKEAFMAPYAHAIKQAVPGVPVIAAGRIQSAETAETILQNQMADLVGLARVLFADPLWPRKVRGENQEPINPCLPGCAVCLKRVMMPKPAFCGRWPKQRRERFLERVGG